MKAWLGWLWCLCFHTWRLYLTSYYDERLRNVSKAVSFCPRCGVDRKVTQLTVGKPLVWHMSKVDNPDEW